MIKYFMFSKFEEFCEQLKYSSWDSSRVSVFTDPGLAILANKFTLYNNMWFSTNRKPKKNCKLNLIFLKGRVEFFVVRS